MRRVQVAFSKRCNKCNSNSHTKISTFNIQTYSLPLTFCLRRVDLFFTYSVLLFLFLCCFGVWPLVYFHLPSTAFSSLNFPFKSPQKLKLNVWCRKKKITTEVRTPFHPFSLHHHFFIHARFDLSLFSFWPCHTR